MKKSCPLVELADSVMAVAKSLRDLSSLKSTPENPKISFILEKIACDLKLMAEQMPALPTTNANSEFSKPYTGNSNIIFFPGVKRENASQDTPYMTPILARPGKKMPSNIPDYRPFLQRDGLILLAWDKRLTESGERYTAYWVTSTGVPRFYASKMLSENDFISARPDHKSYAAEDGIEFYGQAAPVYLVHVAPELMMSNPLHGELRLVHISDLKHHGSKVDFDYKYLLKTEKDRKQSPDKKHGGHHGRAS